MKFVTRCPRARGV